MAEIKTLLVDRDTCIGAASCVAVYPDVFELDEENKAVLKLEDGKNTSDETDVKALDVGSVDNDSLMVAAQSCPVAAIYLYDEDGNKVFPE
ncbi:MAG: ferredoxin [Parcubacteria group bacterium SW_4_49_11]|nr:MAG: ferredoxin [Parcubacteria group bacterium SW_4_49_11]